MTRDRSTNDKSRTTAEHHRMLWGAEDLEFLLEFWPDANGIPAEELEVAEALGRTVEACRQRFYETHWGRGISARTMSITITTTTIEYSTCGNCYMVITPSGNCGCQ